MVCPSVSPENHTSNYLPRSENGVPYDVGDPTQASINAAMDVAIIREVFTHLLAIGRDTGLLDGEEAARYERMLAGSPEYQLNEYGAPREWLHPDFPDNDLHRHQSHLYPMFPGLEKARRSPEDDAAYRFDPKMEEVTRFIGAHLGENLSIDRLAGEFYLSRYYLMHSFKEVYGITTHQYIRQKRLLRAAEEIRRGTPVLKAAMEAGFNDYSAFLRAFQAAYGMSPREWK